MNFHLAKFVTSYGISTQLPLSDNIEIAFAGRSNVGKSSLINKVFNRRNLARVSAMPGKTATINFYAVEETIFVDLPGYGYAKVSKSEKHRWSELIEGYFNQNRNVALVLLLIDIRHSPSKLDLDMVNYLIETQYPFLIVFTKADKLSKMQKQKRLEAFREEIPFGDEIHMLPVSSETGEGMEELRGIVEEVSKTE